MFTDSADLIASGCLEAYVLGALSPDDERLIRTWLSNEQVKSALDGLERDLVKFAAAQSLVPSDDLTVKTEPGWVVLKNSYTRLCFNYK